MKRLCIVLALLSCLAQISLAQDRGPVRVTLKEGRVVDAEIITHDSIRIFIQEGEKRYWVDRLEIKEIVRRATCPLTLEQSPALRGLRLGQAVEDVRKKFPGNQELGGKGLEVFTAKLSLLDFRGRPEYDGLLGLSLSFLDGKLVMADTLYDKQAEWTDAQFRDSVVKGLNLQPTGWFIDGDAYVLQCNGFKVKTLVAKSGMAVRLERDGLGDELKNRLREIELRRKRLEEEKRKVFKP
jgi:hypothetical protein